MAEEFPHVFRDPIEPTNSLLVAAEGPISAEALRRRVPEIPGELSAVASEAASALEPRLPGGEVYTDDRAPVEWLIDASLLGYAGEN
jgi:hypothetical protein